MKSVMAHTDGACKGNPGPGGWGVLLRCDGAEKTLSGGEAHTTNNRMELMAAIQALESLRQPCAVDLYTDSTYVMKGITEWMPGWKRKQWRTAAGAPVNKLPLWQRLDLAGTPHHVRWPWVKGHAGDAGNERADQLANQGIANRAGSA